MVKCAESSLYCKTQVAGWIWAVASFLFSIFRAYRLPDHKHRYISTKIPNEVWLAVAIFNVIVACLMLYGQKKNNRLLFVPYLILVTLEFILLFIIIFFAIGLWIALHIEYDHAPDWGDSFFWSVVILLVFIFACVGTYYFVVNPIRFCKNLNKNNEYNIVHPDIEKL